MHVRRGSSYYASLAALNERFKKESKAPVKLVSVPAALEDEDMLEMMNAGLLQAMVVDDWKAKMWAQVLTEAQGPRTIIVLRPATRRGWAIRKNSPKLAAALTEIYNDVVKKAGVIPYRQQQYMKSIKALHNPTASGDYKRSSR